MGLKNNYDKNGIVIEDAYHRIYNLKWFPDNGFVRLKVGTYASYEQRTGSLDAPIQNRYGYDSSSFDGTIDANNLMSSSYCYLKTLSEFTGSVDL